MFGYDSPEIKPRRDFPNRAEEIRRAERARLQFMAFLEQGPLWMQCFGRDKYGRILGKIYHAEGCLSIPSKTSINDLMLAAKCGVPYFGGTKTAPEVENSRAVGA